MLNNQVLTEEEFLSTYNGDHYEKPSVTVDMLVFTVAEEERLTYRKLPRKVLKLLLIKRAGHPYKGKWALPGGFVQMDESLDEAALRELAEETSIEDIYMEQLYTWGAVERDPRMRVISTSYLSLIDSSNVEIKPSTDAEDARWFTLTYKLYQEQKTITEDGYTLERTYNLNLTSDDEMLTASIRVTKEVEGKRTRINREIIASQGIAFDHGKIIEYGVERLRNKIDYTDIGFNLMPAYFTLTELQQVYEIILDKELLKANFRRKIASRVEETDQYTKEGGHRPSRLYKFNASNNIE